jgi:hypothetical protein
MAVSSRPLSEIYIRANATRKFFRCAPRKTDASPIPINRRLMCKDLRSAASSDCVRIFKLAARVAPMKNAGGWVGPTRRALKSGCRVILMCRLEDAEHDSADKGERNIRGHHAQSADESHRKSPWFTSLPALTRQLVNRSSREK